ncbi:MAG: carbohydrate [Prolixibacteraceae bacterium]|nr:MAG: carbohydrate [Prolixibacteraceae bacterium]
MKRILVSILFLIVVSAPQLFSQAYKFEKSSFVYKNVDGVELEMVMYKPQAPAGLKLPAIVFFFGGGWVKGDPSQFQFQAEYLATRGMVAFCPDYRTQSRHSTTPFESVKDAKSAIRYLKIHGDELGIDINRIVASGGSAGGHLAACTAVIDDINEAADDLTVSSVPMLLVLFNPVVDTGKKGYGQQKLAGREFELSPVHHLTPDVPETLIMHGKADTIVPYENVHRFNYLMKQQGNKCTLVGYKKQGHGFFNYSKSPKYFKKTLAKTEAFLDRHNLLKGESWINRYCRGLANR